MKKLFYALPMLLLTPLIINAQSVNTSFDNEHCVLTVSGSQTGHDASVTLFDDQNKKIGFKTGEINNGNYTVDFVLSYDSEKTIDVTVANELGNNEISKENVVIPVCELAHQDNGNNQNQPETVKDTLYTVEDEAGNIISFKEESGHTFRLNIMNYYGLNDVALNDLGIPKDLYQTTLEGIVNVTKEEGTLIAFYEIEVFDENNFGIHEGPFNIKIKLTDDMKKYNTFKLIYVDNNNNNFVTQTPITLTVNGDYLEGTLDHLSTYALVGKYVEPVADVQENKTDKADNPKTGDHVMIYVAIAGLSLVGIIGAAIVIKKHN